MFILSDMTTMIWHCSANLDVQQHYLRYKYNTAKSSRVINAIKGPNETAGEKTPGAK
jgi:hypothetical protein